MPLAAPLATWFNPRLARAVVLFALAGVPLAAGAASPMRPGLWEQSVSTVVGGERVPASSSKECLSQGDIDHGHEDAAAAGRQLHAVQHRDAGQPHDRTTWRAGWTTSPAAGAWTWCSAADSYDGTTEMSFTGAGKAEMTMTVVINARRIGDCQK